MSTNDPYKPDWLQMVIRPMGDGFSRTFFANFVNYFTKWVEVETLASITKKQIKKFIWKTLSLALESQELSLPTMGYVGKS